jgi:iron complex transport system ATP-binding protein
MRGAALALTRVSWAPRGWGRPLLAETSLTLAPGRVLGVVGPNGAGKSTLLRLLYRYHRPATGTVAIDGEDIWRLPARAVARRVAAVLQEQPTDFGLTVREIVALGRVPHRRGPGSAGGARDAAVIDAALARMDLHGVAGRHLRTLSGGERQRVMVARALAQEPRLLVLDEPTTHLDIRHQLEVLALIRDLPLTIVTSLHDLNMAAGVCDDVLLLESGRPRGFGPPARVLTEAAVSSAFRVTARRESLTPSATDHLTFHLPRAPRPETWPEIRPETRPETRP